MEQQVESQVHGASLRRDRKNRKQQTAWALFRRDRKRVAMIEKGRVGRS